MNNKSNYCKGKNTQKKNILFMYLKINNYILKNTTLFLMYKIYIYPDNIYNNYIYIIIINKKETNETK